MQFRFLLVIAATLVVFVVSPAADQPAQPATKPAAGQVVVQSKVVINGQEVQIQGNGKIEVIGDGTHVFVEINNDGDANAPQLIRRLPVPSEPVTPNKPSSPQIDQLENPPAKLSAYTGLMKQCIAFEKQTSTLQWKTIYEEDFAEKATVSWNVVSLDSLKHADAAVAEQEKARRVSIDKLKDRTVLLFDATGCDGGTLAVGPTVRGNYAVEFVAANLAANPSDLDLFVGPVGQWIGLQFGGQMNNTCALWWILQINQMQIQIQPGADQPADPARLQIRPQVIPNGPRIEKDRFHTVRLEVVDGIIKGFIDGKLIGQGKANEANFRMDQQPHIYTWSSKIAVDRFKTEMMVKVPNANADQAWDKVFAGKTRPQVQKQISELVDMLADEDAAVRDSATKMLKRIGLLAIQPVKDATESGIAEQSSRAKDVLKSIEP